MKKLLLLLTISFIIASISYAWTYDANVQASNLRIVGTAACTLQVADQRGSVAQYFWFKADSVKDSIPALLLKWEYSVDNVTWTAGATLWDSFGSINAQGIYNVWKCESLLVRQYPFERVIAKGTRSTQRAKFNFRTLILK
jgi:hypothetical protein